MSKSISIILLEDVPNLGSAGDIVNANEGYARNSLFPEGKAAIADAGTKAQKQTREQDLARAAAKDLAKLQADAAKIDGKDFTILAQVKEGDELYGSVNADQIVDAIKEQAGLIIKPKQVGLTDKLTRLGTYDLPINLSNEVEALIKITIISADPSADQKQNDEE